MSLIFKGLLLFSSADGRTEKMDRYSLWFDDGRLCELRVVTRMGVSSRNRFLCGIYTCMLYALSSSTLEVERGVVGWWNPRLDIYYFAFGLFSSPWSFGLLRNWVGGKGRGMGRKWVRRSERHHVLMYGFLLLPPHGRPPFEKKEKRASDYFSGL